MKEVRKVHYVKGVFVCPQCRQSYVQEKWIESWRVRCHRCDYRGALTDVSVEESMEEEMFRRGPGAPGIASFPSLSSIWV